MALKRKKQSTSELELLELANAPNDALAGNVVWMPPERLKPFPGNPRNHPDKQVRALAQSITQYGWVRPIGLDESNTILFGHGCYAASKYLNLTKVPTLSVKGLTEAQKRALVIADNKLAQGSEWDVEALKLQFETLINLDFKIEETGFSVGEIDLILGETKPKDKDNEEDGDFADLLGPPVSKVGDCWELGAHRLVCGDARQADVYQTLLNGKLAQMVLTDPPYNVGITKHARGRSRKKHREFAMASGEMLGPQFIGFLESAMSRAIQFSANGSIHFWFMDWRHMPELLRASGPLYSEWKNLLVWVKPNPGQGAFYRSQHELIGVFKSGTAAHINNFGLGSEGRNRCNVLNYAGGDKSGGNRREELAIHPTVKPVSLITDLIQDCSKRNGIVLDLFGGSGTTILAAELSGRRARVVEIDPQYVDLAVRRWQRQTGRLAVHNAAGVAFDDAARELRRG